MKILKVSCNVDTIDQQKEQKSHIQQRLRKYTALKYFKN